MSREEARTMISKHFLRRTMLALAVLATGSSTWLYAQAELFTPPPGYCCAVAPPLPLAAPPIDARAQRLQAELAEFRAISARARAAAAAETARYRAALQAAADAR